MTLHRSSNITNEDVATGAGGKAVNTASDAANKGTGAASGAVNKTTSTAGKAANKTTDTATKGVNSGVSGATGTSVPRLDFGRDPDETAQWLPSWLTSRWKAADEADHEGSSHADHDARQA